MSFASGLATPSRWRRRISCKSPMTTFSELWEAVRNPVQ